MRSRSFENRPFDQLWNIYAERCCSTHFFIITKFYSLKKRRKKTEVIVIACVFIDKGCNKFLIDVSMIFLAFFFILSISVRQKKYNNISMSSSCYYKFANHSPINSYTDKFALNYHHYKSTLFYYLYKWM